MYTCMVPTEFLVQPDVVIVHTKGTKQVSHLTKECPNLAGVMEVTNQGFQLPPLTKTLGGQLFKQCNNLVSFLCRQSSLKSIGVKFNPKDS